MTYSLGGADVGSFDIDTSNGQIETKTGVTHNFDFEAAKNSYSVTVSVRDSKDAAGYADTAIDDFIDVTINLTNVNEAPVITTDSGTFTAFTVDENTETSVVIKTYMATDVDADTTPTWSLEGNDAGDFAITKNAQGDGELKFASVPNFEMAADADDMNDYDIRVKVKDNGIPGNRGASNQLDDTVSVTVDVEDINEAPTITGGPTTMSVPENSTAVGDYAASDVDDPDTQTWSVESADDGNFFEIDENSGALSFINAPNFEDKQDAGGNNVYNVRVKVTDAGVLSATRDVAVTVTNVNEAPVITTDSTTYTAFSVDENTATSVVIKTYEATDVDANSVLTWSLEGNDAGDFTITKNAQGRGELKFANVPNHEMPVDAGTDNVYDVTVKIRDNHSGQLSDTLNVVVTVDDVNEAPEITSPPATSSIAENGTAVVTFSATDVDMPGGTPNTLAWSVEPADDGGKFDITSAGGVLSFSSAPDFETPTDAGMNNTYVVTVKVTDNGSPTTMSDTHTITVTVTNINEAPEITTVSTTYTAFNVDENTATSVVIKTYEATDVDADTTLTWSLEGNDAGDFAITKNAQGHGELRFASVPNFEMAADADDMNDYDIRVKVKDNGISGNRGASNQLDDTVSVTVDVEDINERPVISGTDVLNFAEIQFDVDPADLTDADYLVGAFTAYDDDGDDLTWSLGMHNDGEHFAIAENADGEGVLSFDIEPDFENPVVSTHFYVVEVVASDGNLDGTVNVVVTVTDVDETPEITGGSDTPSFAEIEWDATTADLVVETFTARDEEDEAITWSRDGADASDFNIDSTTGVLSFAQRPNYEASTDSSPRDNVYDIIVKATDATPDANTREFPVAVTVTNVDETPEIDGPDDNLNFREIPYDSLGTPNVATFTARDEEMQNITWSLAGDDAGDFTIMKDAVSGVGVVTFNNPPNFEIPADEDSLNTYEFTVEAFDGTNTGTWNYAVTVTDVNETPELTGLIETAITLYEHDANDTYTTPTVATYTARDEEGEVTWTLTGTDSGDFAIDGNGVVTFAVAPSFEDPADSTPRQRLHVHGRRYRRPERLEPPHRHDRRHRHRRGRGGGRRRHGGQPEPRRGRYDHLHPDRPGRRHRG